MRYELIYWASWGRDCAPSETSSPRSRRRPGRRSSSRSTAAWPRTRRAASLLRLRTLLPVGDVEDKAPIEPWPRLPGAARLPPLIELDTSRSRRRSTHHARPSIDVLFESAADAYRERVIGVILTGANEDGANGSAGVQRLGGVTVVQDPNTAERREMPVAALAATNAEIVLQLPQIGLFLYGPSAARTERRPRHERASRVDSSCSSTMSRRTSSRSRRSAAGAAGW